MADQAGENDRQRFDEWSETYERSYMQRLLFDRVHRRVLGQLPAGFSPHSVLDIGCGTGRLLRLMQARWPDARLVGIDSSEGMVARARQLTPVATIYQASADHIPLQDAFLDLVTTTMSFHHWSDQTHGVAEVARVLKSGGIFVLADINIGHGHPLSRSQVRSILQSSGLAIKSQSSLVPFLTITFGKKK